MNQLWARNHYCSLKIDGRDRDDKVAKLLALLAWNYEEVSYNNLNHTGDWNYNNAEKSSAN